MNADIPKNDFLAISKHYQSFSNLRFEETWLGVLTDPFLLFPFVFWVAQEFYDEWCVESHRVFVAYMSGAREPSTRNRFQWNILISVQFQLWRQILRLNDFLFRYDSDVWARVILSWIFIPSVLSVCLPVLAPSLNFLYRWSGPLFGCLCNEQNQVP